MRNTVTEGSRQVRVWSVWRLSLLAGLVGGLMEVAWIAVLGAVTDLAAVPVARQVAASVLMTSVGGSLGAVTGVLIHLLLSVAVGAAFGAVLGLRIARGQPAGVIVAAALAVLTAVWALNFFVVLPVLNPTFLALVPASIGLVSKWLFAFGMAAVLVGGRVAISRRLAAQD